MKKLSALEQEFERLREENKQLRISNDRLEQHNSELHEEIKNNNDWYEQYLKVRKNLEECTDLHDKTILKTRVIADIYYRLYDLQDELSNLTADFDNVITIDSCFDVVEYDENGEQCDITGEVFRCYALDHLDKPIKPGHCRLVVAECDHKVVAYVGDLAAIKDMGYVIDANTEVVKAKEAI